MRKSNLLPRRLAKEEVLTAPMSWTRILSTYGIRRKKAMGEATAGYNTLCAMVIVAIAKSDRKWVDAAIDRTKENVPKHVYLSLGGSALCDLGFRDEGLAMLRDALKLHSSHSLMLSLAAVTDDLAEKESLAKQVLNENPEDSDALRHLAYAKYYRGEREKAEGLIDKILHNDADNLYALEYKGNICFDNGEYAEALAQYLKITLKPTPISIQFKICNCYHLLGMTGKAKKIAKSIHKRISATCGIDRDIESATQLLVEVLSS